MADALVSIALKKITDVLGQQLSLFSGALGELERLEGSLQSIRAVLADAESRQVAETSAQLWLSRLRDVAYDIDNVLNEWQISVLQKDDGGGGVAANRVRAPTCLPSPPTCLDRPVSRYTVARNIKEIRERLDQIAKDKDQFNTSQISSFGRDRRPVRSRTLTSSHMEEELIGREDDKDAVISRLVSGSSVDDGQVQVIAIVGIGGLGKTTLARKIYHDDKVRNHFEKFLWVCVSEEFDLKRLTKAIIEQVKGTSTSLAELDSLQNELLEALRGKHFLLILDDVWNDDKEKWKRLRPSLTSGAPGSRILVTTRLQKVAEYTMDTAYIHDLKGLSNDHSWMLFSSIAFDGREAEEHSQLESVGREIVNKCKGVPLSITVMGSVMNSKQTVEDWQNILGSRMWSLPEAEDRILPALWLSYINLPPYLKQCFVYCSIYEKDEKMYKDRLVKLWIAQGFVQSQGNRDIEDIGVGYFNDLVAWSIFQEVEEVYEGRITCKMHDLLHDLAGFIMKDETYIYRSENSNRCPTDVRHASLIFSENNPCIPIPRHGGKKLRTLFLDGDYKVDTVLLDLLRQARFLMTLVLRGSEFKILPKTIGKLKQLKYLDLSNSWLVELPNAIEELKQLTYLDMSSTRIVELPNAIGRMEQLRYLDLSDTKIMELPESLSRLHNLQTLNLNSCSELEKLPRGVGQMASLRHFKIEYTQSLECLPTGMGRITSLRSLSKFIVGGEAGCGIDELQRLNSLQGDIEIIHLERVSSAEEARKAELWNKPHLHKLDLKMSGGDEGIAMPGRDAETERMNSVLEGLRPHASLEQLELYCHRRSSKLPSWMEDSSFSRLSKLRIEGFIHCEQNLPGLGKLPNLKSLEIRDVGVKKIGYELYHGSNSNDAVGRSVAAFPKLEELRLQDMQELEEWELTSEADANVMPSLRFLQLWSCPRLEGLPRHLVKAPLKVLEISHCPRIKGTGCSGFPLLEEFSLHDSSEFLSTGLPELPNLKNFKICDLGDETLGDGGWDRLAALQKLEIGDCSKLNCLPDGLTQLKLLEDLNIQGCKILDFLPKRLGQLKKLKSLVIGHCEALTRLPDSLAELESLEQLRMNYLPKLQSLPDGLGQLCKLKSLEINSAEALISVPNSLGQLKSLEHIRMNDLKKLKSLPEGLGQLKKLKTLIIGYAEALICLPNSLGQLESLEGFYMNGLKKLESLPEELGELKKLELLVIGGAEGLIRLPNSLGQLESLESLRIDGLEKLESLPEGLGQLQKLESLTIGGAEAFTCLPDLLARLESLERFVIFGWEKLESLPHWLGQLKKLYSLRISDMETLTCLPDSLGQLESLKSLSINNCKKLKSLPGGMGQLEYLHIGYLEALTCPPDMKGRLKSLERLEIRGWKELESLPRWVGRLKSLRYLEIYDCTALRSLPHGLQDLPLLRDLRIYRCPVLSERCKRKGGDYWPKISRIPYVHIE